MRRFGVWLALALAAIAVLPAAATASTGGNGDQKRAERALQKVEDLHNGIGVRTGRELTPALVELNRTRHNLDSPGKKKADGLLARPTDGNADPQGDGYTVAEHAPFCTTHFCIHYVTSTADAPDLTDSDADGTPDYVELMSQVFETEVFPCENGSAALGCADAGTTGLSWPQAPGDGTRGGDARFDVYIKDLFPQGIFGYVAPDPQPAGSSLFSYLVMDKDFSRFSNTLTGPDEMRVTAAHEYNHVLQFGIDANEDTWMFESTAVYFENKVYPAIDDYLSYMPTWVSNTAAPITDASGGGGLKIYGSGVWNHFIAGRHADGSILAAWQAKTQVNGGSFAPASYATAIAANGGTGFSEEFDDFSAAVAEWRVPGSGFPDTYPDVPAAARPNMTVGAGGVTIKLDHTTFAYRSLTPPGSPSTYTLHATLPAGLKGAVALVGRTGNSTTAGTVTIAIQRLASGGTATVSLPSAETFGRITAVLVNADPTQTGFNAGKQDWNFSKDNQSFTGVQVTSAAIGPGPIVTSDAPSAVAQNSATLNGTVNPNGASTTYFFEYGTSTSYGSQAPVSPASAGSGSSAQAFSAPATGLTRGTTYHYRIVGTNSNGTNVGTDQTFTTLDPPIVTTAGAGAVTTSSAILTGLVDARGKPTTFTFDYGPTTAYGSQVTGPGGQGSGPVSVQSQVTGLTPGTLYHFRLSATNADGATSANDGTFTAATPTAAGSSTGGGTGGGSTGGGGTGGGGTGALSGAKLGLMVSVIKAKLAAVLAKGLRSKAGCGESCSITVKLVIPARLAKKLRLATTLASAKGSAGATKATIKLRFSKKVARALARVRKLSAKLVVTATAPDGRKAKLSKAVTLKR